jgi:glycosyltransferase involved in cell wall biosynthesis
VAGTRLVDCRWLGYTGKGKVTQHLLEGLSEVAPHGSWILWGPSQVAEYRWPGVEVVESRHSPLALAGQRDAFAVPPADTALFLHAVRPLNVRRSIVLVHDTIPLRWTANPLRRAAWRSYLRLSARHSRGVFVYSDASWGRVISDLGVTPIGRVNLPIDRDRAEAVRSRRAVRTDRLGTMLYVGLARPQKNLDRALAAFAGSDFERSGGRFTIVGADDSARADLARLADRLGTTQVDLVPPCSNEELDQLYTASGFLIQPSLEEGFGLPVVEALLAGIPVCCSAIDALAESSQGLAQTFDPLSVADMRAAIDRTADQAAAGYVPPQITTPSPRQFAEEVLSLPW